MVDEVIVQGLAIKPVDRYGRAKEVIDDAAVTLADLPNESLEPAGRLYQRRPAITTTPWRPPTWWPLTWLPPTWWPLTWWR